MQVARREQLAHEVGIELMSAANRANFANNRSTGQRQVADKIENLVTDAFVGKAQLVSDRTLLIED